MDWFTNTLEYHGWYWCWVAYKPHPGSWPSTLHLVHLPLVRDPVSLCGKEYAWMELHMAGTPERIKPPPASYQCGFCSAEFSRLVYENQVGHDAIPAEYQKE